MFDNTRAAGSTGWTVMGGGALGAALATAACGGLFFDLFVADRWDDWFPAADPLADLAGVDASGIDWLTVHRELLPGYILALNRGDAELAKAALQSAVASDPALVAAVDQMKSAADAQDFDAISAAFRFWNGRMDALGVPWFASPAGGQSLYAKTYRTLWDGSATIGAVSPRIRLLTRVDRLNVVEGYLGAVSDPAEGALVVVDRVAEHAADDLWPLLDPESLDPMAGPVSVEVKAWLTGDQFEVLAATAPDRARLIAAVRDIRERACSRFVVNDIPARGFPEDDLAVFAETAWSERGQSCPSVKAAESAAIREASGALADADGLPEALDGLLAFSLRATAIHESRHLGDLLAFGDLEAVPCPGCPEGESLGRGELSAYLSSFAAPDVASCAWVQACAATRRGWGSHAAAFGAIAGVLSHDPCDVAIPPGLPERAHELEIDWLMREDPVTLSAEFPRRVRWPN